MPIELKLLMITLNHFFYTSQSKRDKRVLKSVRGDQHKEIT